MKLELDLEYIDKKIDNLSIEDKNKAQDNSIELLTKILIREEENYCKKKGINRKNLTPKQRINMNKAMNQRKKVKQAVQLMESFDPIMRRLFRETQNDTKK